MADSPPAPRRHPKIYGPFGLFRDPRLEVLSVTRLFTYACSLIVLVAILALLVYLLVGAMPILRQRGWSFLTETRWDYRRGVFGAASMIYGTLVTSLIALLLAAPVGVLAATFIADSLQGRLRGLVKQLIELLAAVPSVVYGLLGIVFLRSLVHKGLPFLGAQAGDTLLTGGLVVAIMILPTIITLSEDALRAVPKTARDAALALGLTRREVVLSVVWPQARSGILASILLGLGRALGETIAVYLVVGRSDGRWPDSLWDLSAIVAPGQTLTTKLGSSEIAISYGDPTHWSAMLGIALLLMITVAAFMAIGVVFRPRRRGL